MIRLRIERFSEEERMGFIQAGAGDTSRVTGLVWFERGALAGRVIIEQSTMIPETNDQGFESSAFGWVPVEIIDESS